MQAAGTFQGHSVYGIKGLVLRASRLQSIVEECAAAAKSNDARDKYFETHVSEFAPCSSKALRSELPSLEAGLVHSCQHCQQLALFHMCVVMFEIKAARSSLASVVAELVGVLPKIGSCRKAVDFMSSGGWERFKTCFFAVVMLLSDCCGRFFHDALEEYRRAYAAWWGDIPNGTEC